MSADPKAKFKKYVGAESGGGRPKGKGYTTELQRQKLKPAHLEVIVTKNKERNHYPKRVSDEKWAEVKADLTWRPRSWATPLGLSPAGGRTMHSDLPGFPRRVGLGVTGRSPLINLTSIAAFARGVTCNAFWEAK